MTPATLTTILNSAPVILQAATKLIALIKDSKQEPEPETSDDQITVESLHEAVKRIDARLAASDEFDLEQTRLIEELARQNELLATSQQRTMHTINILVALVVIALALALFTLLQG